MFAAAAVPVKGAKAEEDDDDDEENIVEKVDELLRSCREAIQYKTRKK